MKLSKGHWAVIVVLLILIVDQIVKIWVKTNMFLYQDNEVFPWFHIRFVENNGMAMGIELGSKLFLTIFRLIASGLIIYYLTTLVKNKVKTGYIICVSLILAGAMGNIVDCIFYGKIFSESTPMALATLFPDGGGTGQWFHGRVVDMFYFPLFSFVWPDWVPFLAGQEFEFFRYIFNVADASISVGIIVLILFYRKTFSDSFEKKKIEE
ncbi:lipoprotein signal peptidase [Bacteroidales bacterium OttesenSCG-928-I14]|nr:lipoprotein signal peptidase [Bacteroidales bacterium OttesenSCG-928-I14]